MAMCANTHLHVHDRLKDGVGQHSLGVDGFVEHLGGERGRCIEQALGHDAARVEDMATRGVQILAEVVEKEIEIGYDDLIGDVEGDDKRRVYE